MNTAKKIVRVAILATIFAFVSPIVFAGTVTVPHGTLSATLGAPVTFSYTPDWYVVNDPTHTIGLGLQPYATLGSTLASIQCQGAANLSVSQNPGWNSLSLTPSLGTATMNLGFNAGLNIEFIAFGNTLQGSLSQSQNWGFYDSTNFSSYLLTTPVTLSGQISQNLVSLNTLYALTLEFGVVIPGWLAGINLNINAVANLDQTIQGANINTSAGAFSSEGQTLNVYTSGTSYQLQNVQETWSDSATLSLGLGADMSADLLNGILSVQLVDFGNVTLISASQTYQLQSSAISTVSFDLSTGGGSSAPVISTVSPATMTGLPISQTQLIRIIGSGFTSNSTLTFNDGVDAPFTGKVPTFISANELDYNISVGTNQANWSVVVVNGAQTSNMKYFTVNAPSVSPTTTGSLVVNLSPAGAVSAGAQWQVDGGGYYSSGGVDPVLTPGSHTVSFKLVSGYTTPASQIVTVTANSQTTASATYTTAAPSTYTLTLNYNSTQGGASASPSASGNIYNAGAIVQLYAGASSGYHFAGWGGNLSGTNNPVNITMNGNMNITANFASGDPNLASVIVTIKPDAAANAGVTWSVTGNSQLRASGTSLSETVGSGYTTYLPVTLNLVPGWLGTNGTTSFLLPVTAGIVTNVTLTCVPDTTPGLLTVTLSPPAAVTAGAQWHVNGGVAEGNGTTLSLPPGTNYTITFDSVSGWTAPASQVVTVQRALSTVVDANYTPPAGQPVISGISPPIGSMAGGTLLNISGANFTTPATVLIGGQSASNVTVSSSTQITCITPPNTNYGSAQIVVQSAGVNATNANGFAYGFANGNKINLLGSAGGSCLGVAVQGNYAYVGEGRNLLVLNVSSPSSPSKIGQVTLPGVVRGIALFGQYAYVADQEGGLQVVNIATPSSPKVCGFYSTTNQMWAAGITIYGGLAYVADTGAGLEIFNLGNPTSPSMISSTNCGGGLAVLFNATSNGAFAYITTGGTLCVIDVSNPQSPIIRGQAPIGSSTFSIAMSGNYIFGASQGDATLHVVDVTNPDAPIGSIPSTGGYATGSFCSVATVNNYLYAESYINGYGLFVFSINGTNLTKVGNSPTVYSSADSMTISGNTAYLPANAAGLQIVDLSNPLSPATLATFADAGLYAYYWTGAATGNTLCTADGSNLKVFDVTQPGQPSLKANIPIGWGRQALAQNGVLYLSGGSSDGTRILNVTTPSSPQTVANISSSIVFNYKMALVGDTLYVAGQNQSAAVPRFAAIDVSTPSSPVVRGTKDYSSLAAGSIAFSVAAAGTEALVGIQPNSGIDYVSILNISNVTAPVEVGTLTNIGVPNDVQMSADGSYAYIMDQQSILHVVNISNPSSPVSITNIVLDSSYGMSLAMRGNELFAMTLDGIYVFDISTYSTPVLTRSYSIPGTYAVDQYLASVPTDLASQNANIYLADGPGGIIALNEQDIQPPNIYITNPTFSPVVTNTTSSLNLGGGSSDNVGVTAITWLNSRGGSGQVSAPFSSWYVSGITLYPGSNILTLTAFDAAGNSGNDILTVIYPTTNQNQTITFPAIADHAFGDAPISLVAAASSGLPVSFSVISGPATLSSSNLLMLTGAGAVTVEADQFGGNGFNPATPVDMNFNVARANQSIVLPPVPTHLASDPPFITTATASSALPVNCSILSGPATVNSSNVVTLLGSGTVTVSACQPGNSNFNAAATVQGSFTVAGSPQFITFGVLSQQRSVDAPFPIFASASSGLPVSFSVLSGPAQLAGNIVTLTGWGSVTVRASQPGNSIYAAAANVDQSLTVLPPNNTIGAAQFTNGGFQLAFYGTVGSNYTLQASSDLVHWASLLNFTCTNTPTIVVDTQAKNYSIRFYRIAEGTMVIPITLGYNTTQPLLANGFLLNVQGPVGSNYVIQVSSDLINWQPLTSFVSTNASMYFQDTTATNYSRRFYRAKTQ